jgi:S-adenosylmethionine:tRNA ribosyltransferase-isomerase
LRVDEFDYHLPPELIAQTPLQRRDESRLLVLDRRTGSISHRTFRDILDYISPGDLMVVNDTRVIPARLLGRRETGGKVEVLLLKEVGPDRWECLVKPGHKTRTGDKLYFGDEGTGLVGTVISRTGYGGRVVSWEYDGKWEDVIGVLGATPLPPYIKAPLSDPERYQTVYAKVPGSAAAPTAGLHFTPALLDQVRSKGCQVEAITLNVGIATFRPVKEENVEEHKIHEEHVVLDKGTADAVSDLRARGGSLFAVGTTVVRTLESAANGDGTVREMAGDTGLFIFPGFRYTVVDHLITNFHLPKSTLLMLVSAFAGKETIMKAYREAVKERYRFFSFGDAMLIL